MVRTLFFLAIFQLACHAASGASPAALPLPGPATAGVYIEDLATGDVLVDINGLQPFVPASITKAVTSASAMTEMAPEFRFTTDVELRGSVEDTVLEGDIVVKVVGDPTLDSQYFPREAGIADSIAAHVAAMGIRRITGTVVIDRGEFVDEPTPAGWMEEDLAWPYGAGHHSSTYRDNKFVLTMPGARVVPEIPGLKVSHTPAKGSLKVKKRRDSSTIFTKGTPKRKGESVTLANPRPDALLVADIRRRLNQKGISAGDNPASKDGDEAMALYSHRSPELKEILKSLMFRSDNTMAEGVLRALCPGKTRDEALEHEMLMWELRDIDTELINLEDGSGLSRGDRLTPYFMADVLAWMAGHYRAYEYAALFPKAGYDGTMKGFMGDTPLAGRLALKTGSMKGVQTYAGYLLADDGLPSHVVVVMVNKFTCGRGKVKSEIEKLLLRTFCPGESGD